MTVLNLVNKFIGTIRVVIYSFDFDLLVDETITNYFGHTTMTDIFNHRQVENWDVICTGRDDNIKLTVYLKD